VTEDKSKTDTLQKPKDNPEIANNTKYRRTKLAWLSRFLRHLARKQGIPGSSVGIVWGVGGLNPQFMSTDAFWSENQL